MRRLCGIEDQLIFLTLHPGWVKTDMGGPEAQVPPKASASGLIAIIEQATLSDSGTFRGYDGRSIGW